MSTRYPRIAICLGAIATLALSAAPTIAQTSASSPERDGADPAASPERTLQRVEITGTASPKLDARPTTSSRLPVTLRETPASVAVIDREAIDAMGALNTQDVYKAVPGVTFSSQPGASGSAFYRGFGAASLSQLYNGITVQYDAIAARPVDAWIVDRVEAIGGPSSFLHGSGAVGGTINVITKIADVRGDETYGRAMAGTQRQLAASVQRGFGAGPGDGHVLRADVNATQGTHPAMGDDRKSWQLSGSWRAALTSDLGHTLAVERQHERVDQPYWGTPLLRDAANAVVGAVSIDPRTREVNYNVLDGKYQQDVTWARSIIEWQLAPGHVLQLLGDVPPDLAQPAAALGATTGLTCGIAMGLGGLRSVDVRLARQVSRQAAVRRRTVGRRRHGGRSGSPLRTSSKMSIQYFTFQQGALRALNALGEALAGAAEQHAVAPSDLQLQFLHQQLEHVDLSVARLHHKAQRLGAVLRRWGWRGVLRHGFTVPSGAGPAHPGVPRGQFIQYSAARSGGQFGRVRSCGHAPVDALQQHGQLRRRQRHASGGGLGPDEAATLQALGQQHEALAVEPQHLEDVAAAATEDEDVAAEGVGGQCGLHECGQTIEALPHVGVPGCDPHPGVRRHADHREPSSSNTQRRLAGSMAPRRRMRAAPTSISMLPEVEGAAAGRGAVGEDEVAAEAAPGATTSTGSNTAVRSPALDARQVTAGTAKRRCARRQANNRLALMPASSAMADTDTPGSRLRATNSRLNAMLWARRRRRVEIFVSAMMCIAKS